jgi:transposase
MSGTPRRSAREPVRSKRLVLLVEKLQRMLFGAKSEKVLRQIEQLEFQLEDLQAANAIEEAQAVPPAERPAPAKPFRRPLPEHLPREVHTHRPAHEACPDCGGRLRDLGEDVAEILEYVRSSFEVLRHVRPKLTSGNPRWRSWRHTVVFFRENISFTESPTMQT